jgi:hypothetical protein
MSLTVMHFRLRNFVVKNESGMCGQRVEQSAHDASFMDLPTASHQIKRYRMTPQQQWQPTSQ